MTRLSLSTAAPIAAKADALVVGLHSGPDGPVSPFDGIAAAATRVGATGKAGRGVRRSPAAGSLPPPGWSWWDSAIRTR